MAPTVAAHLTVHSLNGRKEAFAIVSQEVADLADGQYPLVIADGLLEALRVTAENIRSLGPAGALDQVPVPYREWLAVVDAALEKAGA